MKKITTRKSLCVLLLFALLVSLCAPAANVNAEGPEPTGNLYEVCGKKQAAFAVLSFPETSFLANSSDDHVKSVKSSNPSVVKIKKEKSFDLDGSLRWDWYGIVKKSGKTTITIKKKNGKTHKCKLTVIKYTNPFKKVTIGKAKAVFYEDDFYLKKWTKKLPKKSKKYTVSVKLKKGYQLKKIQIGYDDWGKEVYKTVKNNSKVRLSGYSWLFVTYKDKKSGGTITYRFDTIPDFK